MKLLSLLVLAALLLAQPSSVDFTGKCPVCLQQHLDSKLIPGPGEMTKNTCETFDAPGKNGAVVHHYHECNTTTWQYTCSRGHKFKVLDYGHSCLQGDWPRPAPKVIQ